MSRIGTAAIVLAAALAAPMPALAQGGTGQGGMGRGMGARLLVEQGSVEYLVTKATELNLTDEQKSQLTAIGTAWSDSTKAAREQVRIAMPARGAGAGGGDREAMMQRMQELRPVMEKLRADDEASLAKAMELLDEQQKATARRLLEERMRSAMPRRREG